MTDNNFSNDPVEETSIPQVEGLEFVALADNHTRALRIELISALTLVLIINLIGIFVGNQLLWVIEQWWLYAIYFTGIGFLYLFAPIIAKSKGYAIRDKDIHYKSGIIWKKTVSLPFNRIQHVGLESGPLERFFKLTTLKFFSAGGGKADMKIPALPFERSKKIREFVIQKAGAKGKELN